MTWRVVIRPEVEQDVAEAAKWYEKRETGLGAQFVEEVIRVWDSLSENPLLSARRHPQKHSLPLPGAISISDYLPSL